jgi:hypothetical protein
VVWPVVLGSGTPLVRDKVDSLDMTLLNSRSFERGTVLLAYAAAKAKGSAAKR